MLIIAEFGSSDAPLNSKAIIPSPILDTPKTGLLYTSTFDNVSTLCRLLSANSYPDVAISIDTNSSKGTASVKFYSKLESSLGMSEIKKIASATEISDFRFVLLADIRE